MKGDPVMYGYCEGDLVEVKGDDGEWTAGRVVGKYRRQVAVVPMVDERQSRSWLYANPVRLRRMTPERLEVWLEDGQ